MREKRMILFVALAIVILPLTLVAQEAANAVEKAVPADALVFVQVKDFTALTKQFEETLIAKAINESELLDAARDIIIDVTRFVSAYALDISYDELKEIVGKNVGIAVFEGTDPRAEAPAVFIVDISAQKQKFQTLLNDKIKPKLASIAGPENVSQTTVEGNLIESFRFPKGKDLHLAIIGDVFAFGTLDGVKKLLNAGLPRLADDPNYKAVKKEIDIPSGVVSYLNVEALWGHFEVEWQNDPAQKAGADALGLTAIRGIGASAKFDGPSLQDKVFVYTGDQRTGLLDHFASQPPQAPKSDALVPREYSFYVRLLTGGGPKLFDAFKELLLQTEGEDALMRIEQTRLLIQQQAMLDVEQDIIGGFGNEAFLAVDLSALPAGRRPRPTDFTFIFGMEVQDPVQLQGAIAQFFYAPFFVNQGTTLDNFEHNGTTVHTISMPALPTVRPSYAFVNNFFVFSLQTEPVQASIDAAKGNTGLARNENYMAAMQKLPAESNFSVYLDTARVARALLDAFGPNAPPKAKPLIPVVSALAEKLTGIGVTAKGVENGIMLESSSPIGGPTFLLAAISAGQLAKPADARTLAETEKRMRKIETALQSYKRRFGFYPTSLAELTPKPFKRVPLDPFSKEGQMFQYLTNAPAAPVAAPAPAAPGAPGAAVQPAPPAVPRPTTYILWSVGPDGKQDILPNEHTMEEWKAKYESDVPADVELLKQKIWQFKKDVYPDERDPYDEGDIVRAGT